MRPILFRIFKVYRHLGLVLHLFDDLIIQIVPVVSLLLVHQIFDIPGIFHYSIRNTQIHQFADHSLDALAFCFDVDFYIFQNVPSSSFYRTSHARYLLFYPLHLCNKRYPNFRPVLI